MAHRYGHESLEHEVAGLRKNQKQLLGALRLLFDLLEAYAPSWYTEEHHGLTTVPGSPFTSGNQPGPVAIDPNGKCVFVGNTGGNSLSAYAMDSTGSLTFLSATPIPLGTNAQPSSIAVEPVGKFVFVSTVPQQAAGFALDSNTGALTPVAGSPLSIGAVTRDMASCRNPRSRKSLFERGWRQ